nr:MAG TPA: hypothetical protein [Caudoviricetes sp.]
MYGRAGPVNSSMERLGKKKKKRNRGGLKSA